MLFATIFQILIACTPGDPTDLHPVPIVCDGGFIADGSECVPESCGTGKWGSLPVDEDTVYVDVAAEEGGDGTEGAPYSTIQLGLDRAGALGGGLVAVTAGTWPETLSFTADHADVHLAGRCREMTNLDASVGDGETPGIWIDAGYTAVEVSGVTVSGSSQMGLEVASGEVAVRDSAFSASALFGVVAYLPGVGGMTHLVLDGCLIDGNIELGLFASDPGTDVILRDTTVKGTQPSANGEGGWGIGVRGGATISVEGCLIAGNTEVGLLALDPGTEVTLRDTTVKDTQPNANGDNAWGIEVSDGATLSAEGCFIDGNTEFGLLAVNPGTEITLLDTTVKNTQPNANGEFGRGIGVQDGASLSAEGCLIDRNTDMGLFVSDPGTHVTLRDTTVRDTQPNANGDFGRGISVVGGAILAAEGCLIDGNTEVGLVASTPVTEVILRDTIVKDTRTDGDGEYGRGIVVSDGATLFAEGCLIDGNTEAGLSASDPGTQVSILDSTISETTPGTDLWASAATGVAVESGAFLFASHLVVAANQGPGLLVNGYGADGAWMECAGCTIEGNQFAGAVALAGGSLSISDSTIEGTTPNVNLLGGAGIYAWPWDEAPPTVILTNTHIQDNPIAGVWLIGDGTYLLTGNTISGGIGEPFGSGSRCGDAILARDGVTAWNGTTGLFLQDNIFRDASGSGVFLDGSSAFLDGNSYSGNAVDLVVQNQTCGSIPESYSEAPQQDLCPIYGHPTCHADFFYKALPTDVKED